MSSHDKISDSAFSTPSGGVEVDTTSSLIPGAPEMFGTSPRLRPLTTIRTGPNCPSYQWQLLNSILTFLVAGRVNSTKSQILWPVFVAWMLCQLPSCQNTTAVVWPRRGATRRLAFGRRLDFTEKRLLVQLMYYCNSRHIVCSRHS